MSHYVCHSCSRAYESCICHIAYTPPAQSAAAKAEPAEPSTFDIDAVRNQLMPSVWALQAFDRILAAKGVRAEPAEQGAQPEAADAADARRYRWLRDETPIAGNLLRKFVSDSTIVLETMDREIDAAIKADAERKEAAA